MPITREITTLPNGEELEHKQFCLPRPGEKDRRMEGYSLPRYAADGITQTGAVRVERCMECGAATYDGVQKN